jgi:atlastin
MSSYGKPIQVLEFINNKPHIRDECLKEVFRHPKVTSECKKVIIISMAGDQGVGKSFLLNLCLSYLKYMEKHKSVDSNKWINEADTLPLDGFKWENNAREGGTTVGILLWSEPFLFPLEDGSEVAVFLMDTQGNFDCKEVIENNGIVYGCSTLISSIQIYNISKKMRSYDYEHLVVLSDYGVHATEQREKLFQKLIILMRDWESPDYEYGVSVTAYKFHRSI